MASANSPSLLSQYDDLCRYSEAMITGCENEFKDFVQSQAELLQKLKRTEAVNQELTKRNIDLQREKKDIEDQIKQLKSQIGEEIEKRRKFETENRIIAKKLAAIQSILAHGIAVDSDLKERVEQILNDAACAQKQHFSRFGTEEDSNEAILSSSNYDDTVIEEPIINVSYLQERSSTGNLRVISNPCYSKKTKLEDLLFVDREPDVSKIEKVPEVERCLDVQSSSDLNSISLLQASGSTHPSDYEPIQGCGYNLRSCSSRSSTSNAHRKRSSTEGIPGQSDSSVSKSSRRSENFQNSRSSASNLIQKGRHSIGGISIQCHSFVSKSARQFEKCYFCSKTIAICKQNLKCSRCKMTCHPECKDSCPEICIPLTPYSTKGSESLISDFTSSTSMIPSLIIHCVNEIESRGLKDLGLYRISAAQKDVRELKEKILKGKNFINLSKVQIHALSGTIKMFLRSLKEPLIPTISWTSFCDATEQGDHNRSLHLLYKLVCDLPPPNKETLAFLILHLQRVGESSHCKMPLDSLAKVFGPTIVGYSSPSLSSANLLKETRQQCKIMEKLLALPSDSWQNILNKEDSADSKQFSVVSAIKASKSKSDSKNSGNKPVYAAVKKDRPDARKNKSFMKSKKN